MLTADQVRLRLDHVLRPGDTPFDAIQRIVAVLRETLPELVEAARLITPTSGPISEEQLRQAATSTVEENERLRRALHLSELSRGVPSVAENACDYRSHGTQWGCARCGIPATGQPTVGGDS